MCHSYYDLQNLKEDLKDINKKDINRLSLLVGHIDAKTEDFEEHIKDILRSLAHEVVHHRQNIRGEFKKKGPTINGYAQSNPHLRKMEREAYLKGNIHFRDWEDNYKNGSKQVIKITKESKQMNESNIRATIKRLVAEIIAEEKEKSFKDGSIW